MTARLSVEDMESRYCPADTKSLLADGTLRITFDNNAATGQAVTVSAVNGRVTLNEQATTLRVSAVRAIDVIGSDRDNWIDLHFVSLANGFRNLDGHTTAQGGRGSDVIIGTQSGDRLSGGDGTDQIFAGDGNDTIAGGAGNNTIHHDGGKDTIYVQGNDWIDRLGPGDRVIHGAPPAHG
jgi:Ca2+-binding RTX toxin-like protein